MLLLVGFHRVLPFGLPKIPQEWGGWVGTVDQHIALELLQAKEKAPLPRTIQTSINLGKSVQTVELCGEGMSVEGRLLATWAEIEEVKDKEGCHALYDDGSKPYRIATISKNTNIPASLCAPLTETGAPTMVLGGFAMHRLVGDGINPTVDTANKINAVSSFLFSGSICLDTCMGLGYTSIGAAERVAGNGGKVITVEFDEASIEMAYYNPWSRSLFDGSLPIELRTGDSCVLCRDFPDATFNVVIHDPPARALCRKDLYGLEFYRELRRILKPNGVLFHYIGRSDSRESGRLYKGITERLIEAGFVTVSKNEAAFGVVARRGMRGARAARGEVSFFKTSKGGRGGSRRHMDRDQDLDMAVPDDEE